MTSSQLHTDRTGGRAQVSVVIPFWNPGTLLGEAIQSVTEQSYDNWELVLVDDGSRDESVEIAHDAASRDPHRVFYLQHSGHANRGKSTSRNLGLQHARGTYIVFLDADDLLLPGKLAHQANLLDKHASVAAVYGRTLVWYPGEFPAQQRCKDHLTRLWVTPDTVYDPPELLVEYLRRPGSVPCLCALMTRRDRLLEVGGFDESIQHLYEDQVLLAKLALRFPLLVDLYCGEKYRQHEDSSSLRAQRDGHYHPSRPNPAHRAYLEWLRQAIASEGYSDEATIGMSLIRAERPYRRHWYRWLLPLINLWRNLRDRSLARLKPEPPWQETHESPHRPSSDSADSRERLT